MFRFSCCFLLCEVKNEIYKIFIFPIHEYGPAGVVAIYTYSVCLKCLDHDFDTAFSLSLLHDKIIKCLTWTVALKSVFKCLSFEHT